MIVDYENPLKKMMEEFVPHAKVKSATMRENPMTLFPISNGGHVLTRALWPFLPTSLCFLAVAARCTGLPADGVPTPESVCRSVEERSAAQFD